MCSEDWYPLVLQTAVPHQCLSYTHIPEGLWGSLGKEWSGEQRKRERGGREAEDGEEGVVAGAILRDAHPHRTGLGAPPPPLSVTVRG
jgi:hypothetical protein